MLVTVYTKPDCVRCRQTFRALDAQGTEYRAVDVSKDADGYAAVEALGYLELPVVVTPTEHWSGFRRERLKSLKADA
ncbi:glutaredoxin domain-containing protein [Antrihabitans cavernicola]|uniref:glutaredoxin domain-containing protein n=1 Tax=Antrihabitans cavernicola TaxID=2495913 RepID=UPI001659514D